jgi:hypothetical protein
VKLRTKQDEKGPATRIRWTKDAVCWVATPAEVPGVRTTNDLALQTFVKVASEIKGPIGEVTNLKRNRVSPLADPSATSIAIPTATKTTPRREKGTPAPFPRHRGKKGSHRDHKGERFPGK